MRKHTADYASLIRPTDFDRGGLEMLKRMLFIVFVALILPPWKKEKNKQKLTLMGKVTKIINNFIGDRPLYINLLIVIGLIFAANLPGGESASIGFNEISNMNTIQAQTFTNVCLIFTSISLYFLYSKKAFNYFTTEQPNKASQPTPKSGAAEL